MKNCILISLLAFTVSCGNGGNSSSSTNTPTGPSSVTQTITQSFGQSFSKAGAGYYATVNSEIFSAEPLSYLYGQPILHQSTASSKRKAYIALEGDNVSGFGASFFDATGEKDPFSFIGLSGNRSSPLNGGSYVYDGTYMTAKAQAQNSAVFIQPMTINVNFNRQTISGETYDVINVDENATLEGRFSGSDISVTINDQYGTHSGAGSFYGNSANELAVGFSNMDISGLIYGKK